MEGKKSAGNKTNNRKNKNANRDVTDFDELDRNRDVIEDNDCDKPLSERGYILSGLTEAWEWVKITLAIIATPFLIIMLIKIFTGKL